MTHIRNICLRFWKKAYIFIPLLAIIIFLFAFCSYFLSLKRMGEQIKYHPEEHAHQYNEIMLEVYDNFSTTKLLEYSVQAGITNAMVFTIGISYLVFLLTFLVSEKEKYRSIGIALLILTLIVLFLWTNFVRNFHLTF